MNITDDEAFESNRAAWDAKVGVHVSASMYDVEGFLAGGSSLKSVELEEVGDVAGRSLLHLQCHFGLDTLSWARLGARATGVDFSPQGIAQARRLGEQAGLDARFVCCNVYDLPDHLEGTFDVVFTSYGALCWLPDLDRWARLVARYLAPGGRLHVVEFHQLMYTMDDDPPLRFTWPYFPADRPVREESQGTYAARDADLRTVTYFWPHDTGELVTALCDAGLRLRWLREHPYSAFGCHDMLEETAPGRWTPKGAEVALPMMYSLRADRE